MRRRLRRPDDRELEEELSRCPSPSALLLRGSLRFCGPTQSRSKIQIDPGRTGFVFWPVKAPSPSRSRHRLDHSRCDHASSRSRRAVHPLSVAEFSVARNLPVAKYLRHLAVHSQPDILQNLGADVAHLCWMFEHELSPFPTGHVSKVNICLTGNQADVTPPSECLGIVDVNEFFDLERYRGLSIREQQLYYLERMTDALLRTARQFGWDETAIRQTRDRMLDKQLQFAFLWKKPLCSPDRQRQVQGFVSVGPRTQIGLIFSDRNGQELRRSLLSECGSGSFDLRYIFGKLAWIDSHTVQVTQDNGRDFWLCTAEGAVEFHYPRAASGAADAEFALGRMYFEGTVVLRDQIKGRQLIESAAAKGDKHATNFLRRLAKS